MPSAEVWMKVDGAEKYRALSRRLRQAGRGDLQRKLTRSIRQQGAPALAAVRAAWLAVDVTSTRGGTARPDNDPGLRRRVVAATRIQVLQRGIKISVDGRRVDPRYPSLVFKLDALGKPWRHPVFGHNVWSAQHGENVFAPTLRQFGPAWRRGIMDAIDETLREIDRGL